MKTWRDRYFSLAILAHPRGRKSAPEKGALLANQCDEVVKAIPDVKRYFYLVERKGWYGPNAQKTADIKLVDDLSTIEETRRVFPDAIVLEFSNADFVDTDVFRPLGIEKKYTGIQIAAWERFKRHDLFVKAAAMLPKKKFIKFGHYWNGGEVPEHILKIKTIFLAKRLGAQIYFPFWYFLNNKKLPRDPERMNEIINTARMGILTSEHEGVSRFKMECLSADIPFLVPEDVTLPTKKHIVKETGVIFKPTPEGLAEAIEYVGKNYDSFSPRKYILSHTGIRNALGALKKALRTLAVRDGSMRDFEEVWWDGRNQSLIWDMEKAMTEIRRVIADVG
jgi:glycosyltransferase involved in cell wall biosynthesis